MKKFMLGMVLFGFSVSGFAQNGKVKRSDGTECTSFPCLVATVSLTDQISPIPQTVLFTSPTGGLFRVTEYLESSRVQGSTWGLTLNWTDDLKTWSTGVFTTHAGSIGSGTWIMRAVTGKPITYSVSTGQQLPPPEASFNLFITVEELQ